MTSEWRTTPVALIHALAALRISHRTCDIPYFAHYRRARLLMGRTLPRHRRAPLRILRWPADGPLWTLCRRHTSTECRLFEQAYLPIYGGRAGMGWWATRLSLPCLPSPLPVHYTSTSNGKRRTPPPVAGPSPKQRAGTACAWLASKRRVMFHHLDVPAYRAAWLTAHGGLRPAGRSLSSRAST